MLKLAHAQSNADFRIRAVKVWSQSECIRKNQMNWIVRQKRTYCACAMIQLECFANIHNHQRPREKKVRDRFFLQGGTISALVQKLPRGGRASLLKSLKEYRIQRLWDNFKFVQSKVCYFARVTGSATSPHLLISGSACYRSSRPCWCTNGAVNWIGYAPVDNVSMVVRIASLCTRWWPIRPYLQFVRAFLPCSGAYEAGVKFRFRPGKALYVYK